MNRSKMIGSVFAVLVAPVAAGIIANLGSNWIQKQGGPEATAPKAQPASAAIEESPEFREAMGRLRKLPVTHLFNKKDLDGFATYIGPKDVGEKAIGLNKDPDGEIVVKDGILDIACKEPAEVSTAANYANYLLTIEYRWGPKAFTSRKSKIGAVGVHGFGPHGVITGSGMQGYRVRLDEGTAGVLFVPKHESPEPILMVETESRVVAEKSGERIHHTFKAGGKPFALTPGFHVNRAGQEESPSAGSASVEAPEAWNTLEILCVGDSVGVVLNGHLVNAAGKASRHSGKIQIDTQRAELLVRAIDLRKVGPDAPALPGVPPPSPGSTAEEKPSPAKKAAATKAAAPDDSPLPSPALARKNRRQKQAAEKPER